MIGILTEKPSAKRNFSKALGGDKGKFNGEDYIIVNALGHLYTLKDPELQVTEELSKKYKSWKIENLPWNHEEFKWEYTTAKGAPEILKGIKDVLSKCDEICIATDIDPTGEGDLLAGEILFGQKLHKKKLTRMEFIDESPKSLQKAFINRRSIADFEKDLNYQKALFRSKWDFLSMQFTRVATGLTPGRAVIRQGRLKSTMVYLTGEALEKFNAYEKTPYFQNRFVDENKVVYTNPKETEYDKKEDVPNIYKASDVVLDNKTMKKTPPPKLIDLARLSSMLAPRGYSSKEVLATYQKMYQDGYLSYPRTADKNITHEQFKEMLPVADKIAELMGVDPKLLSHKKPRPTHVKDAGSHGANRPGLKVPSSLDQIEKYGRAAKPIYTTLARNYLAMLCADYEYENQTGHIKDYPVFKGSTNVPKFLGWKEIFNFEDDEDENVSSGLGKIGKPFVYEGYPPKPPTPTMGWLMKQLEKYNVGNGSTRTSTFTEVTNQSSKYPLMNSEKGRLTLTQYGEVSHKLLKGTKIGDVKTTESVLDAMDKIGEGNTKLIELKLKEIAELLSHDIETMKENAKTFGDIEFQKKEYPQVEKETFTTKSGKEISFKKEWGGHTFTDEEIGLLTQGKEITITGLKNKRGKLYSATGKLKQQDFKGKKFWGFKMEIYQEDGKEPVKFDN